MNNHTRLSGSGGINCAQPRSPLRISNPTAQTSRVTRGQDSASRMLSPWASFLGPSPQGWRFSKLPPPEQSGQQRAAVDGMGKPRGKYRHPKLPISGWWGHLWLMNKKEFLVGWFFPSDQQPSICLFILYCQILELGSTKRKAQCVSDSLLTVVISPWKPFFHSNSVRIYADN